MSTNQTAILLAAGKLSASLRSAYGSTSVAMLPVGGRPLIHRSLSYLRDAGYTKTIIGIRPEERRLRQFVNQAFSKEMEIHFVEVSNDRGPGGTLLECLRHEACEKEVTCILGDTLFRFPQSNPLIKSDYVLTAVAAPDASRWCYVQVEPEGKVLALQDKPTAQPDNWPLLIGVYHVLDKTLGISSLESQLENEKLELRHFLEPYIAQETLYAFQAEEWFDCGNMDLLIGSQRRMLESREFNDLRIDELRGTITKRSMNHLKLVDEINYYRLLPVDLQCFYPRVIDFGIKPGNVFLTLEYYGYPTLSELWTFEEFEVELWDKIFRRLKSVHACFKEYSMQLLERDVENFYWGKLAQRLKLFSEQSPLFEALVDAEQLTINGTNRAGWPAIRSWIQKQIVALSHNCKAQVIHGDLCFANILFDPLSHAFKLIDVRGSFGASGIYGDPRYDIAKLLHSIDGGYDLLIHDMFSIDQSGTTINYELFFPEARNEVIKAFRSCFAGNFNMKEIRLIEGMLFLAMPPLHSDFKQRQLAMFTIGIEILNQVMNDENMY